ncbi:hypothetical protein GQR58_005313 [Nymphon striatum]|nr:hypothetical protein GQR58_005313 [Nymphon striatum]
MGLGPSYGLLMFGGLLDHFSTESIYEALSRLKNSKGLVHSPALQKILDYVISQELEGSGESIKAYTIGIDALGKSPSFDPLVDPIVRVNVGRLRKNILTYYENEGKNDPIRIEIPKGSYRPTFLPKANDHDQEKTQHETSSSSSASSSPSFLGKLINWPSSFFNSSKPEPKEKLPGDDTQLNAITLTIGEMTGVSTDGVGQSELETYVRELRVSFSRNGAFKVISPTSLATNITVIDFSVKVLVKEQQEGLKLFVELINMHTDVLVWARAFGLDEDESQIVAKLYVMSTWFSGAITNSLTWEKERLKYARLAVQKDPEFGPAYSVISDKVAYLANVDASSDTKEASEEASFSRTKALELSPGDGLSILNVAISYWHSGLLKDAVRTMQRVLEIDPNNALASFFMITMPYTCVLTPDAKIKEAVEFDASLGKDNPLRWITLSSLAGLYMNRGELELSLDAEDRAAQIFQTAFTLMRRAALLNQLGKKDEAVKLLNDQKTHWPSLSARHFSERTIPRLCSDSGVPEITQKCYDDLTATMEQLD